MAYEPMVYEGPQHPDTIPAAKRYVYAAEDLYIREPNTVSGEPESTAIEYAFLYSLAGTGNPAPNTTNAAPGPVKMSALAQRFSEALQVVQDHLLGTP